MTNLKRAKIVATIGPASNSRGVLKSLFQAGTDVFRLNFSHGTYAEFAQIINNIRLLEQETGKTIAILQDLRGPKIRVGKIKDKIILKKGETVKISEIQEDSKTIPMEKFIIKNLRKGNNIFITDGTIQLKVIKNQKTPTDKTIVFCRVIVPGEIISNKGVNIPGVKIKTEALTEKDKNDLRFGLDNNVDFVALSFVKKFEDLVKVKKIIAEHKNNKTKIIAKIETVEAVKNIDKIIDVSDAIMIARGDLGIEISLEKVSGIQKEIIKKCNVKAKPVITATQMLASMTKNPLPTRAEVSDVANAVLDGSDAVMLSEETAIGSYPVNTVKMMNKIITEIEKKIPSAANIFPNKEEFAINNRVTLIVGEGINQMTKNLEKLKAIVAFTKSGETGRIISAFRPTKIILAVSPYIEILRQLSLSWGIVPIKSSIDLKSVDQMIKQAKDIAVKSKFAKKNEQIIISAGIPFGQSGATNLILVQQLD